MKVLLDIENWPRKEHFLYFKQFQEPFFGISVAIDCTKAYAAAKHLKTSFFVYYLHKTLVAVNTIEPFRYRIIDDAIYIYDAINASATILREDTTFGFSLIKYSSNYTVFNANALEEIDRIKNSSGLFTREFTENNLIHFSALPWINFTSLSHARNYTVADSCPKISFGKMMEGKNGKKTMSMSIYVHHGLIDGFHLSQFVNCLQDLMNN